MYSQQPPIFRSRQQTGHSIMKHLIFGWVLMWIPAMYYTVSPNHYWHM